MNAFVRLLKLAGALYAAAVLAGCAARSVEHFYTVSGPLSVSTGADAPRIVVSPLAIPPMIDRPQFVVRASAHELSVLENHRWAEPLSLDLTHALVEELRKSPGGFEFAERDAVRPRTTPLELEVTISELVAGPGPSAPLRAFWVLRNRQKTCAISGRFGTEVPVQPGYAGIPPAYALAMSRLAEAITEGISHSTSCGESARANAGQL
ncbi:MAG TPA: PqiC family protein [Burkholderiaceae bacterium]|nr:PqiC family protein [Burkholderiaceae bacterium]